MEFERISRRGKFSQWNCLQAHFPFLSGGKAPLRQWIYTNGNNNTASKAHFSLIARESPVSLESSIETACTCTAWAKNQRFSWMIKKGKPFQLWIINWLHIRTYHCSLAHAAYCKLSLSYLHSIVYHLTALQFPLHSPNPLARKLNARLFCHCGPECLEKPRPLVTFESRRVGAWSSPDEAVSKEKNTGNLIRWKNNDKLLGETQRNVLIAPLTFVFEITFNPMRQTDVKICQIFVVFVSVYLFEIVVYVQTFSARCDSNDCICFHGLHVYNRQMKSPVLRGKRTTWEIGLCMFNKVNKHCGIADIWHPPFLGKKTFWESFINWSWFAKVCIGSTNILSLITQK